MEGVKDGLIAHTVTNEIEDKLDRSEFMQTIDYLIAQELNMSDKGLVISLNGDFGSGKTHFLEIWKAQICEANQDSSTTNYKNVISLNAWEEDFGSNPLLSIISALVSNAQSNGDTDLVDGFKEVAKDLSRFFLGLSNGFVSSVTGLDPMAAGIIAQNKKNIRNSNEAHDDVVGEHIKRVKQLNEFKDFLRGHYSVSEPALILVDELDRCRPDYAIEYIEVIKHLFDVPGLVFVLAVDRSQIESTSKSMFGENLNFDNYYLKFVDFEVSLPRPGKQVLADYVAGRVSHFFNNGERVTGMPTSRGGTVDMIVKLFYGLDLKPRQIEKTLRLAGYLFSVNKSGERIGQLYCYGAVLLIAIRMVNIKSYNLIGNDEAKLHDIVDVFDTSSFEDIVDLERWKLICLSGVGVSLVDEMSKVLDLGKLSMDDGEAVHRVSELQSSWGTSASKNNHFIQIYSFIEQAKRFIR